jgi:alpha-tubulin suppressor-like RCC1 family protein
LNGAGAWVTPPGGMRNITKVDQVYGYGTSFMIADGRLFIAKGNGSGSNGWCSALNPNDQSVALQAGINNMYELPFPEEDVGTIVDAGQYGPSAYALFANGNLYTWGYNGYGQLGLGSTTDTRIPTLSNTNVAQVYVTKAQNPSYGIQRIVIRKTNNTYWGCGHDGQYQFGLGTNTSKTSWTALSWIPADALSVWMLGGDVGNMVIQKADGTITVTGYNAYGQLGINSTTQPTTPQNAPLWLGGDTTMRIQQICWGGSYQDDGGTFNYVNITMLLDNGTTTRLVGAGSNNWGTLGTGNTTDSRVPVAPPTFVPELTGRITKIASCGNSPRTMYALLSTGALYSWGYNSYGAVGNGTFTSPVTSPYALSVNVLDILGEIQGWDYLGYLSPSPFIKKADGYYACGYNGYGNLGDTTVTNKNVLTKLRVQKGVEFKFFATYGNNEGLTRLGITTDNTIWAWGYNSQAQIDPNQTGWQAVVPLQFTPNALRA